MKPQIYNRPSLTISNVSAFLRDWIRDDSNHELDWLWAAEQVTTAEEIRYCMERALYINPDNRQTQRALAKLQVQPENVGAARSIDSTGLTQTSNQ
ncbi:MAG: hypothetical protein ABI700_06405 [Chloroflexota bacterium]